MKYIFYMLTVLFLLPTFIFCSIHGSTGGVGMCGIVHINNILGISENNLQPNAYILKQNYPNPFNPTTNIEFSFSKSQQVKIVFYNSLGKTVKQLANANFSAGNHTISWDGTNQSGIKVASAVYYYALLTENSGVMKKMILSKKNTPNAYLFESHPDGFRFPDPWVVTIFQFLLDTPLLAAG